MDEILDSSLDSNGTEEFLKLVGQLTEGTNTFIISHQTDNIVDKFDSVITFTKTRNFSRIEA
jgi:ABC-type multidrug transport system ATPase subunit